MDARRSRLVVDGTPGSDDALVTEGGEGHSAPHPRWRRLRVDEAIIGLPEAKAEGGNYVRIPGSERSVTLRFYGVLGMSRAPRYPDLPGSRVVDEAMVPHRRQGSDARRGPSWSNYVNEEMGLTTIAKVGASHLPGTPAAAGRNATFSLARFWNGRAARS